jgi:hypothetical protein
MMEGLTERVLIGLKKSKIQYKCNRWPLMVL